jgi:hypothetical protein
MVWLPVLYCPATILGQDRAVSPTRKFARMVLSAAIMAAPAGLLMRLVVG